MTEIVRITAMTFWLDSLEQRQKENYMLQAVALAEQARGRTAPNPCVGALLLQDGHILAQGLHHSYGQPHAEAEVLRQAGQKGFEPEKCALFVTLEPCNHQGLTPPCTRAILESGIKHVLVGCRDPNPQVRGQGIEYLQARGVQVQTGIAKQACQDLIKDFALWQTEQRPFILLKLASTLDGRIATRNHHSAWVSGEEARKRVHSMRSWVQAILVGKNTFFQDDPGLDCRDNPHSPRPRQPWAVVVSNDLPAMDNAYGLLRERPQQTIFFSSARTVNEPRAKSLLDKKIRIWPLGEKNGLLDLRTGLQRLFAELSCYYVLCEGGGRLGMQLMQERLVDEFHLVLAPKVLGDEQAVPVLSGRLVHDMQQCMPWRFKSQEYLGQDLWLTLRPLEPQDEKTQADNQTT